jgi:rod shape-determining protein MreD
MYIRVNILTALTFVLLAGLVQASAFDYISIAGTKPDLLLIIAIFFALYSTSDESKKLSMACGLVEDITSSSIFGSYAVSFLITSLFLNYNQRRFYKDKPLTQIIITFFCYIVVSTFALLCNLIARKGLVLSYPYFPVFFKGAFYTAVISPLVFFTLSKIFKVRIGAVV